MQNVNFSCSTKYARIDIENKDNYYLIEIEFTTKEVKYFVNLVPVGRLPNTVLTKKLLEIFEKIKNDVFTLIDLSFTEYGSQNYRLQWWKIKENLEKLNG
jgi:hypothetical protein